MARPRIAVVTFALNCIRTHLGWKRDGNWRTMRCANASPYTVNVRKDANRPGRYRWDVYETTKLRDSSIFSFATRREAQADGYKFVVKLIPTWHKIH